MYKNLLNSKNYYQFLKNCDLNELKKIQIAYELQAGSYEKLYIYDNLMKKRVSILSQNIIKIINEKGRCSIMEVGIGEGNTMRHLIENLDKNYQNKIDLFGIELSFSRIKITKKHIENCNLYVCDMNNIPFKDNSIDIVYTASAIEPNRGKENKIISELYRITKNKLILFEISYKDATVKLKERYDENEYVKFIHETIIKLGLNLIEYKELETTETYNNYLYLIDKSCIENKENDKNLICPLFHDELELISYDNKKYLKSSHLNLLFNIIDEIPILLIDNSIILT